MKKTLLILFLLLCPILAHADAITYGSGATKIYDTSGTAQGLLMEDGSITSRDYLQAVAEGDVAGHSSWSKIGFILAATTADTDLTPQGPATYKFVPDASGNVTMYVKSDSASDVSTNVGAWAVTVYYLDASYNEQVKDVSLNGTANQTIAANMFRINNFRLKYAGTNNAPVGNLTVSCASSETFTYMSAGRTRARQMIYTVPAGKTLYITNIAFSGGALSNVAKGEYARITTKANFNDKSGLRTGSIFYPYSEVLVGNNEFNRDLNPPTKLPEKVDIRVIVGVSSGTAAVTGTLRGWLE
jgi:hypothetical protein